MRAKRLFKSVISIVVCLAIFVCSFASPAYASKLTFFDKEIDLREELVPEVLQPAAYDGLESFVYFFKSVVTCVIAAIGGLENIRIYFKDYKDTNRSELIVEYDDKGGKHHVAETGILYDPDRNDFVGSDERGLLYTGYDFDIDHFTFYTVPQTWQRTFGYIDIFDYFSPLLGYDYRTERVKFEYDGTKYMIQFWKGIYTSYTMIGGEIGIYYIPEGRDFEYYACGTEDMYMPISMKIYNDRKTYIDRELTDTWWITGFTFAPWRPPETLNVASEMRFQDEGFMKAFLAAVDEMGIMTYTVEGTTVNLLWPATK